MRIRIDTEKANIASADLLSLSRAIRGLREEVEDVRRRLRQHSQLDTCRAELRRQEEALSILTARLVNLSTALSRISAAYNWAERKSLDRLDGGGGPQRHTAGDVGMYRVGDSYRDKINQILYQ